MLKVAASGAKVATIAGAKSRSFKDHTTRQSVSKISYANLNKMSGLSDKEQEKLDAAR